MKIFDTISALNHLKEIKERRDNIKSRIEILDHFGQQADTIENYSPTFKTAKAIWFDCEEEVISMKERILLDGLRAELYQRKLHFMINGTGLEKMETELAKIDEGIRGYLVLDQAAEISVTDSTSKVVDLFENSVTSSQFVVYREHEIDLKKEPQLGKVLYKIRADGTLKKMKDNYRY